MFLLLFPYKEMHFIYIKELRIKKGKK